MLNSGFTLREPQNLYRQRGASPIITLLFVAMLAFFVTIIFKLAPPYYDFWSIQKVAESFAEEPDLAELKTKEVESRFDKRLMVSNVRDFKRDENVTIMVKDQVLTIDIDYEVRLNMFRNIDAVIAFTHTVEYKQ